MDISYTNQYCVSSQALKMVYNPVGVTCKNAQIVLYHSIELSRYWVTISSVFLEVKRVAFRSVGFLRILDIVFSSC